jgi:hypothetical protein
MKRRNTQKFWEEEDYGNHFDYESYRKIEEDRQRKQTRYMKNAMRAKSIQTLDDFEE